MLLTSLSDSSVYFPLSIGQWQSRCSGVFTFRASLQLSYMLLSCYCGR